MAWLALELEVAVLFRELGEHEVGALPAPGLRRARDWRYRRARSEAGLCRTCPARVERGRARCPACSAIHAAAQAARDLRRHTAAAAAGVRLCLTCRQPCERSRCPACQRRATDSNRARRAASREERA